MILYEYNNCVKKGDYHSTLNHRMESMLTSNKILKDFIYLNKIKTEILNPDWLKKGKYLSLNIYLFSLQNRLVNPVSRY